jgi:hypothetical protein
MPTGWGFTVQGSDDQIEVEKLGEWLSQVIHEAVHYPAWGKPIFECRCGVLFPLFAVKACYEKNDEDMLKGQHEDGYKPGDGSMLKNGVIPRSDGRMQEYEK